MLSDSGFREVVELIQSADAATGNLEGNIIDGRTFAGSRGGSFAMTFPTAPSIMPGALIRTRRWNLCASNFAQRLLASRNLIIIMR